MMSFTRRCKICGSQFGDGFPYEEFEKHLLNHKLIDMWEVLE